MRFFILSVALFFAMPVVAFAADTSFFGSLVPQCGMTGAAAPCQACDLIKLADNVLKFMIALSVLVASLMFAYAGFLYVTAASNKGNIDSARNIFTSVFIGLILVLIAWIAIDLVLRVFGSSQLKANSLNILTQIECRDTEGGSGFNPVPREGGVESGEEEEGEAKKESTFKPPAGSCAQTSKQLAAKEEIKETPNCDPTTAVATRGEGTAVIQQIKQRHGTAISQCSSEAGIPSSVLVAVSRLECDGANTCNDPANTPIPCEKGGYGATGVSCRAVQSYCKRGSNSACAGVSSMNNAQLVSHIRSNPALSFCASAYAMKNAYAREGDWGLAAASYNGAGGLAASVDCPGYRVMQCPVAKTKSPFPYCTTTCAYTDVFNDTVKKSGGVTVTPVEEKKDAVLAVFFADLTARISESLGVSVVLAAETGPTLSGFSGPVVAGHNFLADSDIASLTDPITGEQYYTLGSLPSDDTLIVQQAPQDLATAAEQGYEIWYYPEQGTFSIFIVKEPIGEVRRQAADDLSLRTSLLPSELCKVQIDVRVSPYVNKIYAGRSIGLPGCSGADTMPGD